MLCRTADTGVNSIYAWKGSCLFFCLAFVVGVVSGQSEAQLSFGFVVAVIILSLPQASNSFSVTLCLAGGLVYQTFSQSLIYLQLPFVPACQRGSFSCSCLSPSSRSATICYSVSLNLVLGGQGGGVFSCPGSASALGSYCVGAFLVFVTQVPSEVGNGLDLEHFAVFSPTSGLLLIPSPSFSHLMAFVL